MSRRNNEKNRCRKAHCFRGIGNKKDEISSKEGKVKRIRIPIVAVLLLTTIIGARAIFTYSIAKDQSMKLQMEQGASPSAEALSSERVDWVDVTEEDSEGKKVTYKVPVPKGFSASQVEGENTVNGGFVIYEIKGDDEKRWTKEDGTDLDWDKILDKNNTSSEGQAGESSGATISSDASNQEEPSIDDINIDGTMNNANGGQKGGSNQTNGSSGENGNSQGNNNNGKNANGNENNLNGTEGSSSSKNGVDNVNDGVKNGADNTNNEEGNSSGSNKNNGDNANSSGNNDLNNNTSGSEGNNSITNSVGSQQNGSGSYSVTTGNTGNNTNTSKETDEGVDRSTQISSRKSSSNFGADNTNTSSDENGDKSNTNNASGTSNGKQEENTVNGTSKNNSNTNSSTGKSGLSENGMDNSTNNVTGGAVNSSATKNSANGSSNISNEPSTATNGVTIATDGPMALDDSGTDEGEQDTEITQKDRNIFDLQKTHNQYVWVPIDKVNDLYGVDSNGKMWAKLYEFSSSEPYMKPLNWKYTNEEKNQITITNPTDYREPDITKYRSSYDIDAKLGGYLYGENEYELLYKEMEENFSEMIRSIKKYGGFYIGRYETGRTSSSTSQAVVRKMNTNIASITWYNSYKGCSSLSGENENIVTSLISGTLWDATLKWIAESGAKDSKGQEIGYNGIGKDSTSWGNYYNSTFRYITGSATEPAETTEKETSKFTLIPTGSSSYTKANNIYDMAGNVWEWTLEAYSTYCRVCRGGVYVYYGNSYPARSRSYYGTTSSSSDKRFSRLLLY